MWEPGLGLPERRDSPVSGVSDGRVQPHFGSGRSPQPALIQRPKRPVQRRHAAPSSVCGAHHYSCLAEPWLRFQAWGAKEWSTGKTSPEWCCFLSVSGNPQDPGLLQTFGESCEPPTLPQLS
jgi:hypothetical protein